MQQPFHLMIKPTGATCNLDCTYCYYVNKESQTPPAWRMSDEVLETLIRQYLAAQPGPEVTFAWQGGEPTLLGVPAFRKILAVREHYRQPGQRVVNTIQTNGTLLDEAWAVFLKENHILVGISLDGPEDLHDQYRVDKGGKTTYARVIQAIELLRSHAVEYNILCTVNRANAEHAERVYVELIRHGQHLQFIPIVERAGDPDPAWPAGAMTAWSVDPQAYGRFLSTIFDRWFAHDIGRIHVQLFEGQIGVSLSQPAGLCVFAETCGDAVVAERDGSIYSCDHYVYDTFLLGNVRSENVSDLVAKPVQRHFGNAKRESLPQQCRSCRHLHRCWGECPKHRFAETAAGEPGLSYLCGGYYHFFEHTAARLDALATGIGHGIPAWETARRWGTGVSPRAVGPNDPCLCGSGKKRKKCCGSTSFRNPFWSRRFSVENIARP